MSLTTPGVQQRSQYTRDWGNFASLAVCPNASGAVASGLANALEVGDRAYIIGAGPAHCVSAGAPLGLDAVWALDAGGGGGLAEYQGFQTFSLFDYYVVPAASGGTVAPGANEFLVVALVAPFNLRSAFDDMIVQCAAGAGGASRGWRLNWNNGNLIGTVYVDSGFVSPLQAMVGSYISGQELGHMHALALRVGFFSGTVSLQVWVGPAQRAVQTSPVSTVVPANNAIDRMTVGAGDLFGDQREMNGGIYGLSYFQGAVTDDEMREILGKCLAQQAIPTDVIAWTNLWQGADVVTAPAVWPADIGLVNLERVGFPEASQAYFPPV